ncbi:MAG TPA: hypothetical protein VJR30_10780 [Bradyrhizobium sp.]|nr:hypothetical protein [Bradyrhizobium sp.]
MIRDPVVSALPSSIFAFSVFTFLDWRIDSLRLETEKVDLLA